MTDGPPAPRRYVLRRVAAKSYRVDYARELNEEQKAVVFAPDGPTLVVAGAGSGKTRTLVYRVSRLIEDGADPASLLLLTFTNRAAREMKRRVESLIGADLVRATAGTFHSVGARLLRPHAELLGFRPNFTILDSEDTKDLLESATSDIGVPLTERRFPKGDLLRAIVSLCVNTGRKLDDVIAEEHPHFLPQLDAIRTVVHRYLERKVLANGMDYDDLLLNWKRLMLERPEIRRAFGARFRHVLVDEYQDVNHLQADLVDMVVQDVEKPNVMVVGDDAQSIYSFRGADFEALLGFPDRHRGHGRLPARDELPFHSRDPPPRGRVHRAERAALREDAQARAPLRRARRRHRRLGRLAAGRIRRPARPRAARRGDAAERDRRPLSRAPPGPRAPDRAHAPRDPVRDPVGPAVLRAAARQGRARLPAPPREPEGGDVLQAAPEAASEGRRAHGGDPLDGRRRPARSGRGVLPHGLPEGAAGRPVRPEEARVEPRGPAQAVPPRRARGGHPVRRRRRRVRGRREVEVRQPPGAPRRPRGARPVRAPVRRRRELPRGGDALRRARRARPRSRGRRRTSASSCRPSTRPKGSSGGPSS